MFLKKFINHNKIYFYKYRKINKSSNKLILLENNSIQSSHVAFSYLVNAQKVYFKANKIFSYNVIPEQNEYYEQSFFKLFSFAKNLLKKLVFYNYFFNTKLQNIYKSFGVNASLKFSFSSKQKNIAKKEYDLILESLHTKSDIERIKINNVWVGDLIYDHYLMNYKKPTINLNDLEFKKVLYESILLFYYWEDYFNINNVVSVNSSHCVYYNAIPLRIAVSKSIAVYQVNYTHIYKLDATNLFAYADFYNFKNIFKELPSDIKKNGLIEAKNRINKRFDGEIGVDMNYSTKSAFGPINSTKVLQDSPNIKILIATHCFFDSPHGYGLSFFPDFYEWLEFLGQLSTKTNYDWYIKTHPDVIEGTTEIVKSFIDKYPKINLIPKETSHHQLIKEGIDFALTVYGTIGFEYAALGKAVINCSNITPHIAYNFNINPKDVEDYKQLLLNLDEINFLPNQEEVYEYYFMKNIFYSCNIFSYNSNLDGIDEEQNTDKFYNTWVDYFNNSNHINIFNALLKFIESHDYRFNKIHFN
jgi:hypothetical protein